MRGEREKSDVSIFTKYMEDHSPFKFNKHLSSTDSSILDTMSLTVADTDKLVSSTSMMCVWRWQTGGQIAAFIYIFIRQAHCRNVASSELRASSQILMCHIFCIDSSLCCPHFVICSVPGRIHAHGWSQSLTKSFINLKKKIFIIETLTGMFKFLFLTFKKEKM